MSNSSQKIDVTASAQGLPTDFVANKTHALLVLEGGSARVREDGVAPDSTTGALINDGDTVKLAGSELGLFKFIKISGTAPVWQANAWREQFSPYVGLPQ